MGLVDVVRSKIEELRSNGVKEVLLKQIAIEIAREYGHRKESVYNAIRELVIRGEVKVRGNRKNRILVLQ